ncbi:hypothetical protein Tco_0311883 [Tanacetum coccineum]
MVVHTFDDVKSVLTQTDLDLFCVTYNIPADLGPELPGPEDTIKDSLEGKIDLGLLDFVKSSDPSKIKTGERTLAPNEASLLIETTDMVVNPSPQTLCLVTHTIADEINVRLGKNKRKVDADYVPPPVKKTRTGANVDSGAAASRAEEFVSSSVTHTLERDCEEESVSNHDDNVRTCPSCSRYVVLSSSSADTDNLTSHHVVPHVPSVQAHADIVATEPAG